MSILFEVNHDFNVSYANGGCQVISEGYLGINNIPSGVRTMNLVFFTAFASYVVVTMLWMKCRMKAPLLRRRGDFGLITVSALGYIVIFGLLLREWYGRDRTPCLVYLWNIVLAVPLSVGPVIVRLVRFRNKAVFYEHMKATALDVYLVSRDQTNLRNLRLVVSDPGSFLVALQALNIQSFVPFGAGSRASVVRQTHNHTRPQSLGLSPEQKKQAIRGRESLAAVSVESVDSGFYTSDAFAAILFVILLFPFLVYGIAVMISSPLYQGFTCVGCESTLADFIVPVVMSLVWFSIALAMAQRVWGAPDPFRILREISWVLICAITISPIGLILLATNPNGWDGSGLVTWYYFFCLWAFLAHSIQCPVQVLRTYRAIPFNPNSQCSDGELDLKTLLSDPTGVVLFQEHMACEFNVESLRFYLEAQKWKDTFDTQEYNQIAKRAYEIFRTFIERGSFMECNLSDDVRRRVEKEVGQIQAAGWVGIPKTLFDEPLAEVWKLMSADSFPRFLHSKLYKNWVDTSSRPSKIPSKFRRSKVEEMLLHSTSVSSVTSQGEPVQQQFQPLQQYSLRKTVSPPASPRLQPTIEDDDEPVF